MEALMRWYYTLRPLKAVQWWHLLTRHLAMRIVQRRKARAEDIAVAIARKPLQLQALNVNHSYDPATQTFTFLNRARTFPAGIDWDWQGEGLLWTYNLNYFEWLYDDALSVESRLATVKSFTGSDATYKTAAHAYPVSLRIVAWIRFLLRHGVADEQIVSRLFSDADWLCRFPEYHLQGNHLWENAVATFCAGAYFGNERFQRKGAALLNDCLAEQILPDGGHIEGSPMYHSLLLWRLLQCIELQDQLLRADEQQKKRMREAAASMLGWLRALTFSDGSWPMFNDCAPGIAPPTGEILRYASQSGIKPADIKLGASGYRLIRFGDFELAIDIAPVQPAWQPGHAHADIGTFCLHHKSKPVIVDTGTSTYDASERRDAERGTAAHNTFLICGKNSSDVWKSFRVGRRAKILSISEKENELAIAYQPQGCAEIIHHRTFSWNDNCLKISDLLESKKVAGAVAFLHFYPGNDLRQLTDKIAVNGNLEISAEGATGSTLTSQEIAIGFNRQANGIRAGFGVNEHLIITIENV